MARASRKTIRYTVGDVTRALDAIAPPALAQSWDNVGLLAGDRDAPCTRVMLCIDLTPPVLEEAIAGKVNLVLAYHPPIFKPVPRLIAQSGEPDAIVFRAIRAGIAIYSPHTALDAAPGGTNDVLARLCGLSWVEPFEYVTTGPRQLKLVTFVPAEQLEAVADALFAAGAGRIGDYEKCSYRLSGEGTFYGTDSTNPVVGRKGRLERVAETRLEVIVPQRRLPEVTQALRAAHPYEEPAFDLYPLEGQPVPGIGRVGALPAGTTLRTLARRLQRATGSMVATIVGDPATRLTRAAVCAGSAGRLPLEKPRSADADVIVTGEIRHHDALTLQRRRICAIALGHSESERPTLPVVARRLQEALPGIQAHQSRRDAGPFAQP